MFMGLWVYGGVREGVCVGMCICVELVVWLDIPACRIYGMVSILQRFLVRFGVYLGVSFQLGLVL